MSAKTIPELLLQRVQATPDSRAFSYPVGSSWKTVSWKEFGAQVRQVAMGLRVLGLQNEQRAAILAHTRYEWIVCDIGINCAAGATTTIYPSNLASECAFIIKDSDTQIVFAENDEQVKKLKDVRSEISSVKKVITLDGKTEGDWIISYADLMKLGEAASQADFEKICASVKSSDLATLIYTSGTTGQPKGVELTQDNWVYEAESIDEIKLVSQNDVQFFWLPLAHSFGKVLEVAQLKIGFETAIDGRIEKLVENLAAVKPTFVAAVPRIFEKVYNKSVESAKKGGNLKYSIFRWAIGVGKECSALRQKRQEPGGLLAMKEGLAQKLVFSKLQERFGGRLKYFVSGSAPLSREMAEFFHACGILILEGYGLTETSAFSFVNRAHNFKFGTVGQPAPTTEVKIAKEDGEILLKGRGVMRGYHNLPDATADCFRDGWFATGDIGELDAEGLLRITDRKKDLIKTSGGKYVAPQSIEGKFKAQCPYISNVLVHGNNRNFCTMLISLDKDAITDWAKTNGITGGYPEIVKDARAHALIKPFIQDLNKGLASYESIKNFAILPKDLTIEEGELTPSQKVKRKVVETKFKDLLDGFYAGNVAEV